MHLCRSWVVFGLFAVSLAPFSGQAMVVYKWTDADGVVHFSDQPVPGAERIVTAGTSSSRGVLNQAPPRAPQDGTKGPATPLAGTQLTITSPSRDQTFSGDEPVMVYLAIEPPLKAAQTIVWTLNGAQVTGHEPTATQFALTDLARGSYTLEATLTDPASGESRSADPVTFNVLRPSVLSPQHK